MVKQYIVKLVYFISLIFGQASNLPNYYSAFPNSLIKSEFEAVNNKYFFRFNGLRPSISDDASLFNVSFNSHFAVNIGHPNIDNNAEFYGLNGITELTSARFTLNNSWLWLGIEPYILYRNVVKDSTIQTGYLNNQNPDFKMYNSKQGLRQSGIILHYKGIGLSYSNFSQWWGPGFHSSITLSSNAPGINTYSIGSFKEIHLGRLGYSFRAIVSPYESKDGVSFYHSGFATHLTYYSNPTITLGLFRTYLSGNFSNLSDYSSLTNKWTIKDAFNLIFEPLFGQSKSNLSYTTPGTPGFDRWDEILSGYINITFPENLLKIYLELGSDDNRGNLTDLLAHWDHTLGYLMGFRKYFIFNDSRLFIGSEYFSTKISNTFNPKFFRGNPNTRNFYAKTYFDEFTYQGRRMGGHSGSSSDDIILIFGFSNKNINSINFSFSKERHYIKSMKYPEIKYEFNLMMNYVLNNYNSIFLNIEFERINNYGFKSREISESKLFWFGYSLSIR